MLQTVRQPRASTGADVQLRGIVLDNSLQKKVPGPIREKGQYFLAFGVIASMLLVTNFPPLVIFFFAVFAYLVLKMFSIAGRSETRDIFEFYLTSHEILRDDDRRWFGFEIREAIMRGEGISHRMTAAPPLVNYAIGALYHKIGDHKSAIAYLSRLIEQENADERAIVNPSPELRNYVRVLRKIERDPADAPLTSNAVRALERGRRIRGSIILAESRNLLETPAEIMAASATVEPPMLNWADNEREPGVRSNDHTNGGLGERATESLDERRLSAGSNGKKRPAAKTQEEKFSNRKPISEVLHDIYDGNVR